MLIKNVASIKKALYEDCLEYICDKGHTPHIMIYTAHPKYTGTREYETEEGTTIFNIGGKALISYSTDDTGIIFSTNFKGINNTIEIPWDTLLLIFSKEDNSIFQRFPIDFDPDKGTIPTQVEKPSIKLVHSTDKPINKGRVRKPTKLKLV